MITCLAILVSFLVGSLAGLSLRPPRPESVALVQLRRRHAALVERVLAATGGDREEDIAAGLDELAAVRAAGIRAQEHVHQLAGQLDRVYRERNAAAAALVRAGLVLSWHAGWYPDPDRADGWPVLSVRLPGLGEVTWHVPTRPAGIPAIARCWDGHTSAERDVRLDAFISGVEPPRCPDCNAPVGGGCWLPWTPCPRAARNAEEAPIETAGGGR